MVEAGHLVILTVKNSGSVGSNSPALGTDVDGKETSHSVGEAPTAGAEKLVGGMPSITLPIDNDPQEITEIGTRKIQKFSGNFKTEGRLEKWKSDGQWKGAVLGHTVWTVLNEVTYTPSDEMPKYELVIYVNNKDTNGVADRATVPVATDKGDEKVKLTGVKLTGYDRSIDSGGRVKETITYTAEWMETVEGYTIPA